MKRILFVLIFSTIVSFIRSQAPPFLWETGFAGGLKYGHSVVTDASNNVYTFGDFQGMVFFDPLCANPFCPYSLTSNGNFPTVDLFVTKHDPSGNLVWAQQIDYGDYENAKEMAIDPSGNLYVTGEFQNTTGPTPYEAFVSKLNGSGNVLWNRIIQRATLTSSASATANEIDVDAFGNSYISGLFGDTVDFDPGIGTYTLAGSANSAFILKLNTSGAFVWAKQLDNVNNLPSITTDNSGNNYITGQFYGTSDFDPGPGTYTLSSPSPTTTAAFMLKLNSGGNFCWAKKIDFAGGIVNRLNRPTSHLYYTGSFSGITDFDPGPSTFTMNSSLGNVYISKTDTAGNFIWASQYSVTPQSITLDGSGNPYFSGYFSGTVDIDPSVSVYTLAPYGGGFDAYMIKLNPNGNFVWAAQIGGSTTSEDAEDLIVDQLGNVFFVGMCDGNTDCDPGPAIYNSFYGNTHVEKLGPLATSISELNKFKEFLIYPNPNNGQFNLIFDTSKENTEIKIFNSLSQIVLQRNISSTDKISLSISDHPTGIYFLEINDQNKISRCKIIKE